MRPQEGRRGGEGDGWLAGNLLKSVSILLGNMAVEHVFQKHSPLTLELLMLQDFFFGSPPPVVVLLRSSFWTEDMETGMGMGDSLQLSFAIPGRVSQQGRRKV